MAHEDLDPSADAHSSPRLRRRDYLAGAAAVAAAGSLPLAGCGGLGGGDSTDAPSRPVADERARALAERYAPVLHFDAAERWFPTDPRPYASEVDGETVVDGFDALDGYTRRFREAGRPPDPTVFYRAVRYGETSLGVVQWWLYSAFDQFTTNFHWHDWELLQAFVDLETDAPVLYSASAHSRSVPNNEFLDPPTDDRPHVLAELGSHSSALSVNEAPATFQRLPGPTATADVTNAAIGAIEALASLPAAYGLPRDEGLRLPFLVPELDGRSLPEHPDLPAVDADALIPDALTVRRLTDLADPPADLPARSPGLVLEPAPGSDATVGYELVPTTAVESIDAFTGPRLSFEFSVPGFLEDAVASHISTTGVPWGQPRYVDPAADVTDPRHRQALADRFAAVDPPGGVGRLVASVLEATETEAAPDGEGLETVAPSIEAVALVESAPVAVPTFQGAVVVEGLPAGEHRLTVNAAGTAPHGEAVTVDDRGAGVAGVEGAIPLVPNRDAVKLRIDPAESDADLVRFAVEDDFAGRLYDAPLAGPDAVYVHRGGAYTSEVEDARGALGAFRVTPATEDRVTIERPGTGKAVLATYVADLFAESRAAVADRADRRSDAVTGLLRAIEAVSTAANRAAERARAGERGGADEALARVIARLDAVAERLAGSRQDLPTPLGNALERRLAQGRRRAEQARASEPL